MDFNRLIEEGRRTSVFSPGVQAASQWLETGKLTSRGLSSCIKLFSLAGMVDDAIDSLKRAERRGLRPNTFNYNAAIAACRRHKRFDEVCSVSFVVCTLLLCLQY